MEYHSRRTLVRRECSKSNSLLFLFLFSKTDQKMQSFSLLNIPDSFIDTLKQNFISSNIDYKRFSFSHKSEFFELINDYFPWNELIDSDNSNSLFTPWAVLVRVPSPRWRAFQYIISIEGIGPIPLLYIEQYSDGLKNSVGRVDFYGAFFHFRSYISDRIRKFFSILEFQTLNSFSGVRCTRIDVALDFSVPFPLEVQKWIVPSKNSLRSAKCYNWIDDRFHSISYLTKKNSWYGVRMYDKIIDINQKGKQLWYCDNLPIDLTRLEFEFYPPYSNSHTSESILSLCSSRIFWFDVPSMWLFFRPNTGFNVENAYAYFLRYAKSKWMLLSSVLSEISKYHLTQTWENI